jgi:hypothetical protein
MLTVRSASVDDIWPPSSGGCPHPPAVRDEIIRVARSEIRLEECRNVGFAAWYSPYFLAEQRVLERQQRQPKEAEIAQLRADNRALAARVDKLERHLHTLVGPPGGKGGALIKAVGEALGRSHREIEERIDNIERAAPVPVPLPSADDLAKLDRQGPPVYYAGVWDATKAYSAGALVTQHGAGWIATNGMAPGVEPGKGPTAWKLAVKAPTAGLRKMVQDEVAKELSKPLVVR